VELPSGIVGYIDGYVPHPKHDVLAIVIVDKSIVKLPINELTVIGMIEVSIN